MRRRSLRLIAAKELLDTLRDRRTLFVALVLPLLLYPALLLGLTQIIGVTQRNLEADTQKVLLDGADPSVLADLLRAHKLEPVDATAVDGDLGDRVRHQLATLVEDETDDARARLRRTLEEGDYAAALVFGEGFAENIRALRQADVSVIHDPTDEASKMAFRKIGQALDDFRENQRAALLARYPDEQDRLQFAEEPVRGTPVGTASSQQKGAYSFAPMLGMLIVIMALTGAFYPAVDLVAGEKERGTLETLLVAPVTRTEIVLGKFLAIWLIAVVTALLNLAVMGLTFSKLAGMMGQGRIAFDLPLTTMAVVTLILIPSAALFSAVALALSSFATSYKEGQHYMSPLFLVATPLAMVALLPNIELGYTLALVPVANVVLLVKGMLLGGDAAGPALVATVAMAVYAAVALYVAVAIFRRESVLFRTGSGRGFDPVSLRASRAGLPAAGLGLLLFFAVLALMFFLSGSVGSGADVIRAFLLTQIVAILLPTLLLARRAKVSFRRTFPFTLPRPAAIPAIVVASFTGLIVVTSVYGWLAPAREAQGFEQMIQMLLSEVPSWLFFACLALLPPVCEEILCRGFLLSAFRSRFGVKGAIVISAALFGALHLDLYRFPATFVAGLFLGYVRVRTGTLLGSILFHVVWNGTIAAAMVSPMAAGMLEGIGPWHVAVAAIGLVAGLAFLHRVAGPADIDNA